MQVPLIVHGVPELFAGWSETPVELVDLSPTLLQAAGVELPLVESGTYFLSRGRMIRTLEWKYAHYMDDLPELYDLRNDPWELENLAGRPEHREREDAPRTRLLERAIAPGDPR